MLSLGALAFVSPWMLSALVILPVLWWLLRVTPPAPQRIAFPAIRLLLGLRPKEETPAHTPLWLLLLRMLLAALVILALAHPLLNPGARLTGPGPVVLVIDDGWAAAASWNERSAAAADIIDQAERERRPVLVLTTAPPATGEPLQAGRLMPAAEARNVTAALQPKPWPSDRAAALRAIADLQLPEKGEVIWLSDGLDDGGAATTLAERLQWFGLVQILRQPPPAIAKALLPPALDGVGVRLKALRAEPGAAETLWVRASADQGRLLAREPMSFPAGETAADLTLALPSELRNRLIRVEIEDQPSAGAVVLLDERWRRRPVGLVSGAGQENNQPLLSDLYYLERALAPFAEVRSGSITDLLQRDLAVLVLSDIGQVVGAERRVLEDWLQKGGTLVRFAGPRLAESADDLIPVRLRGGGRALGGALSWDQPARLAPFAEGSPFHGLAVPQDVVVTRQVLAEPSIALGDRTWARLEDGTPLVTADRRGEGQLVLFHSTANTQWSNLPISGLFVEMLRRIVTSSHGVGGEDGQAVLGPLSLLDGYGRFAPPGPAAMPVKASEIAATAASPRHPPGFYGSDEARRALNLTAGLSGLAALPAMPSGIIVQELTGSREFDLLPWLLTAAIILGIADLIAALALRGLLHLPPRRAAAGAALLAVVLLAAGGRESLAQTGSDDYSLAASLDFRLAYVLTGDNQVDEMSRAGLAGLTDVLNRRTSVEGADPLGVNIERDEVMFFPLLYWPMVPAQAELSAEALAKLDAYMKNGGTVLFDTRDQDLGGGFGGGRVGPGTDKLRRMLAKLDVPPLVPVPQEHILTKAFYLMQEFPGRWSGGQVWVERHAGGPNDGVSSLVVGGNDWAAAWAIDDAGRPLALPVPGGAQQREMAYRFGVNLVMYTLTGNYKADQVHVPALLERLGQ